MSTGPVVGFDLDMTLVDSRPGIAATFRAITAETGVPVDTDVVVSRLGPKLEEELAHWFPAADIPPVADRYRELYADLGVPGTRALPGALAAVDAVRTAGGRSLVVTAKFEPNAHLCLTQVCIEVDVDVGDTPPDMVAARAANAVALGVTTGPHARDELLDAGADVVLASLTQFPAWFRAWRRDAGAGDVSAAAR